MLSFNILNKASVVFNMLLVSRLLLSSQLRLFPPSMKSYKDCYNYSGPAGRGIQSVQTCAIQLLLHGPDSAGPQCMFVN